MPFPVPARLEKISLVNKKSMRDDLDSKKGALQGRVAKAVGFDTFEFNLDENQVLAYASSGSPGADIYKYFDKFTSKIEEYTKNGEDAEAKATLQKIMSKKEATLSAAVEEDGIGFCGVKFRESKAFLLFKHDQFGRWQSDVCNNFNREVDIATDAVGEGDLPLSTKRAINDELEPRLKKASDKFQKMFGKPISLGYNVKEVLEYLKKPDIRKISSHIRDDALNAEVPKAIGDYFERAADTLEKANFGTDDMMQEAFLEGAEKGVVFELVPEGQLKNNQRFNDCLFEEGYFKLQTVPSHFGRWVGETAKNAADRL